MNLDVIILGAGKGTRMNSSKAKVLHLLGEKTLISHVVDSSRALDADNIVTVIGYQRDAVRKVLPEGILIAVQEQQLGTGHAVAEALGQLNSSDGMVLVLLGDVPLVTLETLQKLLNESHGYSVSVLTAIVSGPGGLGRIIRDENGELRKIVEAADATDKELDIKEINSGIMAIRKNDLIGWLPKLDPANNQGELYLTDIVELALKESLKVKAVVCDDPEEVMGINSQFELARAERILQKRRVKDLATQGARVADLDRLDIRGEVDIGKDCFIDVNVVLEGNVKLGDGVTIGPGSVVIDSILGSGVKIHAHTVVEGAEIAADSQLGPFARVRPGTIVGVGAKIGNFVETKKAHIGPGSKASHLAYLGDTDIGADCNIGAGTVTCNYDGISKNETKIGDNVFIGTNSTLVAPLVIDSEAFVAAGSTITTDVSDGALAVGRAKQKNIDGWVPPSKRKQR